MTPNSIVGTHPRVATGARNTKGCHHKTVTRITVMLPYDGEPHYRINCGTCHAELDNFSIAGTDQRLVRAETLNRLERHLSLPRPR